MAHPTNCQALVPGVAVIIRLNLHDFFEIIIMSVVCLERVCIIEVCLEETYENFVGT